MSHELVNDVETLRPRHQRHDLRDRELFIAIGDRCELMHIVFQRRDRVFGDALDTEDEAAEGVGEIGRAGRPASAP